MAFGIIHPGAAKDHAVALLVGDRNGGHLVDGVRRPVAGGFEELENGVAELCGGVRERRGAGVRDDPAPWYGVGVGGNGNFFLRCGKVRGGQDNQYGRNEAALGGAHENLPRCDGDIRIP
jgi:hypothetical protein